MARRVLVVQVAALGLESTAAHLPRSSFRGCEIRSAEGVFPALTCTAQASFRTASEPAEHGMVFNGVYSRRLRRPSFWEQSSALVSGRRIWSDFRSSGGRVGMLFWQQSLGEEVDLLLSPWPIHTHGGGLVDAVHSVPEGLYGRLVAAAGGRPFRLHSYWGPLASRASSRWIASATEAILTMEAERPELLLTYLPHLDYALQRYGPRSFLASRAYGEVLRLLTRLHVAAERAGYEVVVFGDYAVGEATDVVYPNRLLYEKGLFSTRDVKGRSYPDFHSSRAFAVVDHEVAHVYVQDQSDVPGVAAALCDHHGRHEVLGRQEMKERGVDHPSAGDLMLVGRPGAWLAYPWWRSHREAPDFATHVDIHNKPGFDPCELFFGWPPPSVSTDPRRVAGTHGAVGPGREVAWWSTFDVPGGSPRDIRELAHSLGRALGTPR